MSPMPAEGLFTIADRRNVTPANATTFLAISTKGKGEDLEIVSAHFADFSDVTHYSDALNITPVRLEKICGSEIMRRGEDVTLKRGSS